jgi:hypothetical protein
MGIQDNQQEVNRTNTFQVGVWIGGSNVDGIYCTKPVSCIDHRSVKLGCNTGMNIKTGTTGGG